MAKSKRKSKSNSQQSIGTAQKRAILRSKLKPKIKSEQREEEDRQRLIVQKQKVEKQGEQKGKEGIGLKNKQKHKKHSYVFQHSKILQQNKKIMCLICKKELSFKNNSTTSIIRHLTGVHSLFEKKKTQQKLLSQQQFEDDIARSCAVFGNSFTSVSDSSIILSYSSLTSFKSLLTRKQVVEKIQKIYERKKSQVINVLNEKKTETKFHLLIDSTYLRRRCFFNFFIIDGDKEVYYLGVKRSIQKGNAEEIIKLTKQKLNEFELSFNQISFLVSDSGSNLIRMAKILEMNHQRCYAHMLNNAMNKFFKIIEKKLKIDDRQYTEIIEQLQEANIILDESFSEQSQDEPEKEINNDMIIVIYPKNQSIYQIFNVFKKQK